MGRRPKLEPGTPCPGCGCPVYSLKDLPLATEEDARPLGAKGYCRVCYNAGEANDEKETAIARARLVMFLEERRARGIEWYGTEPDAKTFRENRLWLRKHGDGDGLWGHD